MDAVYLWTMSLPRWSMSSCHLCYVFHHLMDTSRTETHILCIISAHKVYNSCLYHAGVEHVCLQATFDV